MTTAREHMAMEAAGASDAELAEGVEALLAIRHLTDEGLMRLLAYRAEQDIRALARFNEQAEKEMGSW